MTEDVELDRARAAYRERDARESPYRWDNPGYVGFVQANKRALLRAIADTGAPLAGAQVLDVGCGTGYYLHRLLEYGAAEGHGVDLVPERIEEGRVRYPSLDLRVGNAAELPFGDGELDVVTQFTCLSSILDGDVRLAAAREMRRVGGWVVSYDMRSAGKGEGTQVVALDEPELRRLFGEPALLRRVSLRFDLWQILGRHAFAAQTLAALPPLRSHLLGVWRPTTQPTR